MSISVIIPVFNGEKFIAEAIDSVLAQTYKADEIIVIDDGSSDRSAEIIMSYASQVKYIYQANSGVSAARNNAIKLAQGEYIAFLDHDDVYLPDKLENAVKQFMANRHADIIAGTWKYFIANQSLMHEATQKQLNVNAETAGILLGSYLFKHNVFTRIGLFDEKLHYAEDIDLIMRANNAGMITIKSNHLGLLYRYHDTNSTKLAKFDEENKRCTLDVLYKSILERRGLKQ